MSNTNRYRATGLNTEIERQGRRRDWLANEASVHQSFISHLVAGRRTASATDAEAIANALNVDLFLIFELSDGSNSLPKEQAA